MPLRLNRQAMQAQIQHCIAPDLLMKRPAQSGSELEIFVFCIMYVSIRQILWMEIWRQQGGKTSKQNGLLTENGIF